MRKKVQININDSVWVQLTDMGKQMLKAEHDKFWTEALSDTNGQLLKPIPEYKEPQVDEAGFSRFQLWDLMGRLGPGWENALATWKGPFLNNFLIEVDVP